MAWARIGGEHLLRERDFAVIRAGRRREMHVVGREVELPEAALDKELW